MNTRDRLDGISRRAFLRSVALGGAALGMGGAAIETLTRTARVLAATGRDTLVIATDTAIQTFDPHIVYDNTVRITRGIYEGLVTLKGSTPEIVPRLATEWTSTPDARQWTFKLRPRVLFHDRTVMDAEAVKQSFERLIKINRGFAWAFKSVVASIQPMDPVTVRFLLKGPDPAFLAKLASVSGGLIVSPKAVSAHARGNDLAQGWLKENVAGTGPYVIERWDKGQQVVLRQFPEYWGGWKPGQFKRIVFKLVREASTQRLLLERGDIDVATIVAPDMIDALEQRPGIKIEQSPTMRIFYIAMNTQRDPLKDLKLRQALSYAFDYEGAKQAIFNGRLAPLNGPLPDNDPAHLSPSDKPYRFDLKRARELLGQSVYPNGGVTLSLYLFEGDPTFRKAAEILQANLKELKIEVKIQEFASSVLLEKAGKPETAPDLLPVRNYPDYADSSSMISSTFGKESWGTAGWNFSFYANDRVEQLLKSANEITDQPRRLQMFREAQRIIVAEAPAIFIGTLLNRVPMRSNVQGYAFNPLLGNTFNLTEMSKS
jgi:peptide/nickel transport system substrate-binding protein